jgi:SAM-dependent methyltransferase
MPAPFPSVDPLALLHPDTGPVLDAGCNVGALLAEAVARGAGPLAGVDLNPSAVALARERLASVPGARVEVGSLDALPFDDGAFALAYCLEVLEHVPATSRRRALEELHRVLRPGGRLCLAVPHAGAFAALDPHNLRFRVPSLHRWAAARLGGAGREAGLPRGEADVHWHHHFSCAELEALTRGLFLLEGRRFRSTLLEPLTNALEWPFYRRGLPHHPAVRALQWLRDKDRAWDMGERLAYDVVLLLRRT